MAFSYQKMSVSYQKQRFSYHPTRAAEPDAPVSLDHALNPLVSVAAFLPARLLTHVRHVFADEPELFVASSWQELESVIRRKPVSVVLLDPAADGIMNVGAVASLLKRYP